MGCLFHLRVFSLILLLKLTITVANVHKKKAQLFLTVQKTKAGFFKVGESNIESVQPSEADSSLVTFLETKGPGIQHICFEVDHVEAEVKAYLDKGATLIDQKPRPGAHNTKVAFVHPKSSKWCSHRTP